MMKLLFICTHNRCRSILAEAVFNHFGNGRLIARSAGSQPVGEVHPLSLHFLTEANIPTDNLSSQSWDRYENWHPQVVITVCDAAAGETCPLWFGRALRVHWGLSDPSRLEGSQQEVAEAFRHTLAMLRWRAEHLLSRDLDTMNEHDLEAFFKTEGSKPCPE